MSGLSTPPLMPVPPADSALNDLINHVIGSKLDTIAGNSLYSRALQAIAAGAGGVVPAPDSANNAAPADIPGNKLDTVAGDSLYARALQLLARLALPGADSANNVTPADVIGQKGDSVAGDSIYALQLQALAAIAGIVGGANPTEQLVYPDITGAYVNVPTGAVPPAYSAYVEIVPAATITNDFVITHVLFDRSGWGGDELYAVQLAYGAGDTLAGEVYTWRLNSGRSDMPVSTVVIPANSRVRARTANLAGGGNQSCGMRLAYREV